MRYTLMTDFSGTSIFRNDFVVIGRGDFRSARPMWPMWPEVAKSGSKNQNLDGMRWSLDLFTIALDSSHHFGVVRRQNRIKIGQVMAKSGRTDPKVPPGCRYWSCQSPQTHCSLKDTSPKATFS